MGTSMREIEATRERRATGVVRDRMAERDRPVPGERALPAKQAAVLRLQRSHGNRHVQRAVTLARQAEGDAEVAPEIEEVIDRERSGGQALNSAVRAQMEPFFRADFSAIRIHTGAQADALNRALSARAFTTGRDIFFREGEYNPESTQGRELLAHELTHVVQQRDARVWRKLTKTQPEDPAEREAEEVSRLLREPNQRIDEQQGRLVRPAQASALSVPRYIQRLTIRTPGAGVGVRLGSAEDDSEVRVTPTARFWVRGQDPSRTSFGDQQLASITLSPGSQGILQVQFGVHFFVDNSTPFTNEEYDTWAIAHWPVRVSPEGELTISDATPVHYSETGEPNTQLYLGSIETAKGSDYVTMTVNIVTTTQSGRSWGVGYEVTQSAGGRTWAREFRLNIIVPRGPAPRAVTHSRSAYFRVGSHQLEEGAEAEIVHWYMGLSQHVRQAIEAGAVPISLHGYASTPQPGPANRELSRRRAEHVQQILRDIGGSNTRFRLQALGEYQAASAGEERRERRVDIEVIAQEPRGAASGAGGG